MPRKTKPTVDPDLIAGIGRRLFEEQVRLRLDTKTIATAVDYTPSHIASLRSGQIRIPAHFLALIAPLGFDVQYILTGRRAA